MRARVAPNHVASRAQFSNLIYREDRKSTRLNSSHRTISYAVFCLKKKTKQAKKGAKAVARSGLMLFRLYQLMNAQKVDDPEVIFDKSNGKRINSEDKYDSMR